MIVNDVIDLILRVSQEREYNKLCKIGIDLPQGNQFVLSEEYFNIQKNGMLEQARIYVSKDKVQIDEFAEFQDIELLGAEITNGYWVGEFACSLDSWVFNRYSTKKEAIRQYNKIKVEYFVVEKILFHTEKGILLLEYNW